MQPIIHYTICMYMILNLYIYKFSEQFTRTNIHYNTRILLLLLLSSVCTHITSFLRLSNYLNVNDETMIFTIIFFSLAEIDL